VRQVKKAAESLRLPLSFQNLLISLLKKTKPSEIPDSIFSLPIKLCSAILTMKVSDTSNIGKEEIPCRLFMKQQPKLPKMVISR